MPAVSQRQSLSAEMARAAALQAEFNEKKWVWVPDEKEGYLAGWVIAEDEELGEVVMAGGGEVRRPQIVLLLSSMSYFTCPLPRRASFHCIHSPR